MEGGVWDAGSRETIPRHNQESSRETIAESSRETMFAGDYCMLEAYARVANCVCEFRDASTRVVVSCDMAGDPVW